MRQARRRTGKGESAEDAIEFATAALMKKLLHNPSVALRKAGEAADHELIDAARELFGLTRTERTNHERLHSPQARVRA